MSQTYAQSYAYAYGYPLHGATANTKAKKNNSTHPSAIIEYDTFIFPDFKAIAQLNLSNYTDLVYSEVKLHGYEIYLVQQWICQRKLSSIITSYTGNSQDVITAVQITLPKDFNLWPGKFKQYYDELIRFSNLNNNHTNPQHNDNIFITNLFNIPLSLNILNIIDGDLRLVWEQFKINYNLKMLNCLGRSSVLLSQTSTAAKEKFAQLYKIPINNGKFLSSNDIKFNDINFLKYEPLIPNINNDNNTTHHNHKRSSSFSPSQNNNLKNILTRGHHHNHKYSKSNDMNTLSNKNTNDNTNILTKNNSTNIQYNGNNNNSNTHNSDRKDSINTVNSKDSAIVKDSPIIELIKLIQICLFYFDKYNETIDGLFCSYTKAAIDSWWKDFGNLYFGISKPKNESILGPSTVSAIISLVLSSFYKLKLENCIDDTRNPFNINQFITGIANFQRKIGLTHNNNNYSNNVGSYNLPRKTYLDHITLEKLFELAAKYSNKDISNIKTIMKFKMKDLTGKDNLIHYSNDMVTTDIDTLVKSFKNGHINVLWEIKNCHNATETNNENSPGPTYLSRNTNDGNNNTYTDYIISTQTDDPSTDFSKRRFESHKNFVDFKFDNGNPELERDRKNRIYEEYVIKMKTEEQKKQKQKAITFNPNNFVEINFDEDRMGNQPFQFARSVASVSSMKPNYDKPNLTPMQANNSNYKREFFRRNSIPFVNDGTNDTENFNTKKTDAINYNNACVKPRIYRCNSLSSISDFVDRWNLPFDPSIVKIARNLKKISLEINAQETFDNVKDYDTLSNYFSRQCPTVDLNKYRKLTQKLQDIYNKDNNNMITFKGQIRSLDDKRQMLAVEMKEINSLSSKLSYDIKILELRVRDVESSINQFDDKLKHVKISLNMDDDVNFTKLLNYTNTNEKEFEEKINEMFNLQNFCYDSLCMRVVKRDFFAQLKLDIKSWFNYFFGGIFKDSIKNHDESCQKLFQK